MAILNGTLAVIKVEGTTIAYLTSNDLSFEMATREATTKDSAGNKEILEGLKSFSGSASGYIEEGSSYEDLYGYYELRQPVTVMWTTDVATKANWSGECYITSLSRTDGLEESSTFEVSFEGTGAVTQGTN